MHIGATPGPFNRLARQSWRSHSSLARRQSGPRQEL